MTASVTERKKCYTILMGDFSAKFGARKEGESRADNLEGQIKLEMKC